MAATASKKVSKSKAMREVLSKNPDATNEQLGEMIRQEYGIKIKEEHVPMYKYAARKALDGKVPAKRSHSNGTAPARKQRQKGNPFVGYFRELREIKKTLGEKTLTRLLEIKEILGDTEFNEMVSLLD